MQQAAMEEIGYFGNVSRRLHTHAPTGLNDN